MSDHRYDPPGKLREPAGDQLAAFGITHIDGARINMTDPPVSERQRRYMGAALSRKRAGKPRASDPHMTDSQMRDYARRPKR